MEGGNYENTYRSSNEIKMLKQTEARSRIENIMGKGKAIRNMLDIVELYAEQDCPILFEGETGVGKREIVNYLHSISPRGRKKLVTIDCGTLSKSLIEPELFGRKRGAYTGADTDRIGQIEVANGSTLFLDNIHCLSVSMQHKFLNVIENQEFRRVGCNKPIKIDVRIVAAGNKIFKDLIEKNRFCEDLYYRFVRNIKVPNLTVRSEDMDFLINKSLKEKADELGRRDLRIDARTKKLIKEHHWNGNVRQFENFIHHIITLVKYAESAENYTIPFSLVKNCLADEFVIGKHKTASDNDFTMETALNKARKNAFERAFEKSDGDTEQAIALLKISPRTYQELKKKHQKIKNS